MKVQWLLVAVLCPLLCLSQENSSGPHLQVAGALGMAAGQSAVKPLFQLTSGIYYHRWFGGVGIGLDPYRFKSIPLFAIGKMHFGKAGAAFLYGSGGYNFPFKNKGSDNDFFVTTDRFFGGLYIDAGLGYRIRLSSLHRLLLSAGYSQKNIVNKLAYSYQCLVPPCNEVVYKYHYELGRVVTKLSWEFGK